MENLVQELEKQLHESASGSLHARFAQLQLTPVDSAFLHLSCDEVVIEDPIDSGATGLISRGEFRGQKVAVKQIHRFILSKTHVMDEFKREIKIMASIQHPNLVRFIGAVFDENAQTSPLILLELLQMNLRFGYENHNIEGDKALSIFCDVAYGLHYLHEHQEPIIHRDVSAPNVLLEALPGGMWRAKLTDFGSANFLKHSQTLAVGAIVYTAPEMFPQGDLGKPTLPVTTKCDVFSYGIVLLEVVTRRMPSIESRSQQLRDVENSWRMIYDLIMQCTKSRPQDRPTMSSVLNTLHSSE